MAKCERHNRKSDSDAVEVFKRKRNAHAYITLIVFIILYPLGTISIHLPTERRWYDGLRTPSSALREPNPGLYGHKDSSQFLAPWIYVSG